MAKKLTNSQLLANGGNNNLSFKDIMVQLSPPKTIGGSVRKRLKMIGEPIAYLEYQARVRDYDDLDDKGKPKVKNKDFPDKEMRKSFSRIGHDEPDECPWKAMGYIHSHRYAQVCLERQDDGTYVPRILNKGATVFKPMAEWEKNRLLEREEGDNPDLSCFLGGRASPEVVVTCHYDPSQPGNVKYEVSYRSVDMTMTDEHIEMLTTLYRPTDSELAQAKSDYLERKAEDPRLPKFEEWFECGFNMANIFKHTPLLSPDTDSAPSAKVASAAIADDDGPQPVKAKAAVAVLEEEDERAPAKKTSGNVFEDLDGEGEGDDWGI